MEIKEITKIKKIYYNEYVLEKIITQVAQGHTSREVAFLNYGEKNTNNQKIVYKKMAFRGMTFGEVWYLKKTLDFQGFFKNDMNLYCSVARIKQLPPFPFDNTRSQTTKVFFKDEYKNYIIDYDIFLDFDFDVRQCTFDTFISEVSRVVRFLDKSEILFEFVFSGSRGFKILIPNIVTKVDQRKELLTNLYNLFVKSKILVKVKPDLKCSFTYSQLMKINYSLVFKPDFNSHYPNYDCRMALPIKKASWKNCRETLIREQNFNFFNFNLDILKAPLFDMTPYYNDDWNKENLSNFIESWRLLK